VHGSEVLSTGVGTQSDLTLKGFLIIQKKKKKKRKKKELYIKKILTDSSLLLK
jgi:hypothetical protein